MTISKVKELENNKAKQHIKALNLERHIEGGNFKEIYTCDTNIDGRSIASSIYFLIEEGDFSAFHIIGQDEQWVYVGGDAMLVHMISKDGEYTAVKVGTDYANGEVPSFVVPANTYFASESTGEYSLVVCNVFPAFRYEDFHLCTCAELSGTYPEFGELVGRLTRR